MVKSYTFIFIDFKYRKDDNLKKNEMERAKSLGIWMDHAHAHLIEFSPEPVPPQTIEIESAFTHEVKEQVLLKGESHMHNKEQHEQATYYKELGEVILKYQEVLLFGPTDAKVELFNTLKDNHLFADIKIDIQQTDKMTVHQAQAYTQNYFQNKFFISSKSSK